MRIPIVEGDLYVRDGEIQIIDEVLYFVTNSGENKHVLDIPALERDAKLAKVHDCNPLECRDYSHTWRARDAEYKENHASRSQ